MWWVDLIWKRKYWFRAKSREAHQNQKSKMISLMWQDALPAVVPFVTYGTPEIEQARMLWYSPSRRRKNNVKWSWPVEWFEGNNATTMENFLTTNNAGGCRWGPRWKWYVHVSRFILFLVMDDILTDIWDHTEVNLLFSSYERAIHIVMKETCVFDIVNG